MAKRKQAENHSQRLADAMNSIYTASTPLTSILPVQERIQVAKSSEAARGKGSRKAGTSTMPQKLLLQITDPGSAPSSPKAVANPGTLASPNFSAYMKGIPPSFGKKGWDTKAKSYKADIAAFRAAQGRYNNYTNELATYDTNKRLYDVRVAQRDTDTRTNLKRTAQYRRDIQKFFETRGKKKVSKKVASKTRGSRSRSSQRGSR